MKYKLTIKWKQGGPCTWVKPHTIWYYKSFEKANKDLELYKNNDEVYDAILENV